MCHSKLDVFLLPTRLGAKKEVFDESSSFTRRWLIEIVDFTVLVRLILFFKRFRVHLLLFFRVQRGSVVPSKGSPSSSRFEAQTTTLRQRMRSASAPIARLTSDHFLSV